MSCRTLWFRNTWSWGDAIDKPQLSEIAAPKDARWAVQAEHPTLGTYHLYGRHPAETLYTENESNTQRLWGHPAASPYVKDAFHRYVVNGEKDAVNPDASRHQVRGLPCADGAAGTDGDGRADAVARRAARAVRQARDHLRHARGRSRRVLRRAAARSERAGPEHPAQGARRHDLEQAVLPPRRRALAGRRPVAAAARPQARPQSQLAAHEGGRRHLDARQVGIPVVRGSGTSRSTAARSRWWTWTSPRTRSSCC